MRLRTLTLTAAIAAATLGSLAEAQKIAPGLQRKLGASAPVEVIVRFRLDRATGGKELLRDLRGRLREALGNAGRINGLLNRFLGRELRAVELWLDQSIVITAPPELIRALAALPEVELVFENFPVRIPRVAAQSAASAPTGTPWHLEKVGAPALWSAGHRGQNVRVGHLDTGVDASHPELAGKVAAFAEFADDGSRRSGSARDTAQHGTHTAGLIVGKTVGAAPDARLLSALVLPNGEGTFAQVIAGMQWTIDPDNNAATDDGADIVSMSLGLPGTYQEFVNPVRNMLAAGIMPVFAAGNFGPEAGSTASPGNIPDVLGIGATDQNDAVPSYSSRGPVAWTGAYTGTHVKPDLVAPGAAITSAFPGGGYGALSGTSQAAPIAAGGLAALLSAQPNASFATMKDAVFKGARRLSGDQKSNTSGWGLLSLPGALAQLGGAPAAQQPAPAPAQPAPAPTQPAPAPAPAQPAPEPAPAQPAAPAKLSILLVDDDAGLGPNVTTYYRDPIRANASTALVWDVAEQGPVPLTELRKAQLVVWATGEAFENTITAQDQNTLRGYLEGGGRLLVTGQDVGYDIGASAFYTGFLKTRFVADSSGTPNLATSGPLGSRGIAVNQPGGAINQYYPDVVAPASGAVLAGTWGGSGTTAGTLSAQSLREDPNDRRADRKSSEVRGLVDRPAQTGPGRGQGQGRANAPGQNRQAAPAPRVSAQSAGEPAGAIVLNDAGRYRTATVGFGLESLAPDARAAVLRSLLDWFAR